MDRHTTTLHTTHKCYHIFLMFCERFILQYKTQQTRPTAVSNINVPSDI